MQTATQILIVDDDEIDRLSAMRAMRTSKQSIEFDEASSEAAAVELLKKNKYDCLLIDYHLVGTDGIDFIKTVQRRDLSIAPIIILSGTDDENIMLQCLKAGAQDYLLKSELTSNILMRSIRYARERKQVAEHLRFIAHHDPLTGLANRTLFMSSVSQAMARARRKSRTFALFFIDLDHFKEINDTLGHDVGDTLLIKMAQRMTASVRESDIVSRFGGDEFAVLIDEIKDKGAIIEVAEAMQRRVAKDFQLEDKTLRITPSIGIALFDPADDAELDAEGLVQRADMAMYHAKKEGRNGFSFYEREMHLFALERTRMKQELTRALERREFEVYYQPQYDIEHENIVGLEALLRWNHPQRGLVSPAEFIPLAEETGLIVSIGKWVLDQACSQIVAWRKAKVLGSQKTSVSVNVSALQLKQQDFCDTVKTILEKHNCDGSELVLELTESMLIEDVERCAESLEEIAALGVRVAIDDFGTGYASFRHMLQLPLSYLKIDKSFVDNVVDDQKNADIVTAIIAMAKALGLHVIAEGVENRQQAIQLRESGCTMLQGYLFSKPVPADKMKTILANS